MYKKAEEEMAKYFRKDEYGVKSYDKDGKEIVEVERPLVGKEEDVSAEKKENENIDKASVKNPEEIERERLDGLKKEVEEARKKYAAADYDEDKKNSWFKSFFGKRLKNVPIDTKQVAYTDYREKLKELSDYEVGKLEKGNFSTEELNGKMEELIMYFNTDEKLNLYEARTNARTEDWERSAGGKMMKKAGDFTNWYRKQNVWTKGAVGAALSASGLAVGAFGLGAVAAAGVGIGVGSMRIMGGAAAGVGTNAFLEARHRAKEKETADEKRKEIMIQLEGKEAEEKFKSLMDNLDLEMNSYESSLTDEKAKAITRRAIGVGVGALIGSGAMSELLKGSAHMIADTDTFKSVAQYVSNSEIAKITALLKEKVGGTIPSGSAAYAEEDGTFFSPGGFRNAVTEVGGLTDVSSPNTPIGETSVFKEYLDERMKLPNQDIVDVEPSTGIGTPHAGDASHVTEAHGDNPVSENHLNSEAKVPESEVVTKKIDLEVKKNSSLEGTLIKHLKLTGMDAHEAGAKAHRMALAFAKEHGLKNGSLDLIHPGAHIEIDSNGKILGISGDSKLGYLHHNADTGGVQHEAMKGHAGATPESHPADAQKTVPHEAPQAVHPAHETLGAKLPETPAAAAGDEALHVGNQEVPTIATDHSYESFSNEVRGSVQELAQKNNEILSHFSGLKSMSDVTDRISYLENSIELSIPPDNNEDRLRLMLWNDDLEELKIFRDNMTEMYRRTTHAILEIKSSSDSAIFNLNASQYLIEHPEGKAAKIFREMRKTLGPARMTQYGLNPKPSDNLLSWSNRMANFVLKNNMEK